MTIKQIKPQFLDKNQVPKINDFETKEQLEIIPWVELYFGLEGFTRFSIQRNVSKNPQAAHVLIAETNRNYWPVGFLDAPATSLDYPNFQKI